MVSKSQGNKWGYVFTYLGMYTYLLQIFGMLKLCFLPKGMYLKKIGLNNGEIVKIKQS